MGCVYNSLSCICRLVSLQNQACENASLASCHTMGRKFASKLWGQFSTESYIVISFGIMLDHFSVVGDTVNCCAVCSWRRLDCSVNNRTRSPPVISVALLVTDSKLSVLTVVCHFTFYLFCTAHLFFHLTGH